MDITKGSNQILTNLFNLLWHRLYTIKAGDIRIPDTVFILDDFQDWFFTSKSGFILKKGRYKLTAKNILSSF
jgi:hypothetical protein